MTDDLAFALRLADAADQLTLERFGALDLRVDTKPDLTPVSDADRAAEELIRRLIGEEYPDDAVLGEEFGATGTSNRTWIIDPIDGTKNYVRGVPVWATLIALTDTAPPSETRSITLGVVSAPALGRRWWASRGMGAWLATGGEPVPIRVSGVAELSDASVSFSEWNDPAWEIGGRRHSFDRLLRSVWRSRAYGDFWSHMMVAEGSADAALEPELSSWDMAALVPIIEEAGGTVTALDGTSPMVGGNAVSTNTLLHQAVLAQFSTS